MGSLLPLTVTQTEMSATLRTSSNPSVAQGAPEKPPSAHRKTTGSALASQARGGDREREHFAVLRGKLHNLGDQLYGEKGRKARQVFWDRLTGKGCPHVTWAESAKNAIKCSCKSFFSSPLS